MKSYILLLILADSVHKHDSIFSEVHEDPACQYFRTWCLSSKSGKIRQYEIQESYEVNRCFLLFFTCYKGYVTACETMH